MEIWKRFRKWGGIPSGLTQNVKDLLASREIENIFENSDFIYMLNQAQGDRQILAKQLGISPHQLSYVTHSGPGEGLLFFEMIIPFVDHFSRTHCCTVCLPARPDEIKGDQSVRQKLKWIGGENNTARQGAQRKCKIPGCRCVIPTGKINRQPGRLNRILTQAGHVDTPSSVNGKTHRQ